MMTKKNRIYIAFGTYFIATIGLFFTGTALWYLLIIPALIYVFIGGRNHV